MPPRLIFRDPIIKFSQEMGLLQTAPAATNNKQSGYESLEGAINTSYSMRHDLPPISNNYKRCKQCRKYNVPSFELVNTCLQCRGIAIGHDLSRQSTLLDYRPCKNCGKSNVRIVDNRKTCKKCRTPKVPSQGTNLKKRTQDLMEVDKPPEVENLKKRVELNSDSITDITEYQTSNEMFKELLRLISQHVLFGYTPACAYFQFSGRYSIIADSAINHKARALLVGNNLRELKLNNDLNQLNLTPKFTSNPNDLTRADLVYGCPCLVKNGKTNHRKGACGGAISISVEIDSSHWLGIPGQKVKMVVKH